MFWLTSIVRSLTLIMLTSLLPCFFPFFSLSVYLLSLVVDWLLDSGYHLLLIAFHANLSHCFCICAVNEQGSVHEYAVELLVVFCCVVCWFCGVRGIGQVAKLLAARAEVRLTRAFGSGTVRQGVDGNEVSK